MSEPARLVHAGSAVVDYVYRITGLPAAGTEVTAEAHDRLAGGGFNMMVAARRTGMNVAFAGQHGTGPNGDFLRAAFAKEQIDVLMPRSEDQDSGNCVALVTADAERTFVSWPGAEGTFDPKIDALTLSKSDWVFTSGYTLSYPGSRDGLAAWIERLPADVRVVFDPAPVVGDIPPTILARVLARTTWLSCNTAEAAVITGSAGRAEDAAELLLSRFCPQAEGTIIRAGEKGCYAAPHGRPVRFLTGFKVETVDTNGAGDTHIGAFTAALSRGLDPYEAAHYANAAAAISVTRHGGSSAPDHAEIETFLSAATSKNKRER